MLAAKFFDDQYFNNAYYGKVGGVNPKEINSLEIEFLCMINFNLYVTTEEYQAYHQSCMTKDDPPATANPQGTMPVAAAPNQYQQQHYQQQHYGGGNMMQQ